MRHCTGCPDAAAGGCPIRCRYAPPPAPPKLELGAYREPAPPHVCRYDVVRWPPPHHDVPVRRCTCGEYEPTRQGDGSAVAFVSACLFTAIAFWMLHQIP